MNHTKEAFTPYSTKHTKENHALKDFPIPPPGRNKELREAQQSACTAPTVPAGAAGQPVVGVGVSVWYFTASQTTGRGQGEEIPGGGGALRQFAPPPLHNAPPSPNSLTSLSSTGCTCSKQVITEQENEKKRAPR